jgi:hypothetical protein
MVKIERALSSALCAGLLLLATLDVALAQQDKQKPDLAERDVGGNANAPSASAEAAPAEPHVGTAEDAEASSKASSDESDAGPSKSSTNEAVPQLIFAPPSAATEREDIVIGAKIEHRDRAERVLLLYLPDGRTDAVEVEFRRARKHPYLAVIPGDSVRAPGLGYWIELELADGSRVPAFASRKRPHRVQVQETRRTVVERNLLERHQGRRSRTEFSAEWVSFGKSPGVWTQNGTEVHDDVDDGYFRIEGGYSYRPFGIVSEFGVRLGLVRGTSPVEGAESAADFDVGLNYAAPWLRLRLSDFVHAEGQLLTGVTEVDFTIGAGGALRFGDAYGTHLGLGFEAIEGFGTRAYSHVEIATGGGFSFGPTVEATNMPNAENMGVRLLVLGRYQAPQGYSVGLSGGYQARDSVSGGPGLGGTLGYEF